MYLTCIYDMSWGESEIVLVNLANSEQEYVIRFFDPNGGAVFETKTEELKPFGSKIIKLNKFDKLTKQSGLVVIDCGSGISGEHRYRGSDGPLRTTIPLKEGMPPFSVGGYTTFISFAMQEKNDGLYDLVSRMIKSLGFTVISEDWNNLTTEGNTETFQMNITLNPRFQISSATLVYNNTNNLGTFTNTGGNNYTISESINVPAVNSQKNITFNWSIILSSGEATTTTIHNQTVQNIGIDDCTVNTVRILNYSLRDEEDRTFLNGTLFNTTIEVDVDISPLGTTNSIINFSRKFTQINPAGVCLSINLSSTRYRMDVTTRYESKDRISEFHHIQNNTLTNLTIPININLHDLKTVDSTTFLITFENQDFLPESNALIDITRKYIGDGVFRSVEIGKTDANGQTLGHFVVSDATYTIIISKEGTILSTFENILAICNDAIIGDCKINLNAFSTSTPLEDFRRRGGITFTGLLFDEDARTVTTSFTSTTGTTKTVILNATKFDRFGKTQVCSDSLTSSAGSLTCTIPASLGNITIIADLFSDGLLVTTQTFTINPDARANWGSSYSTAIFMGILIIDTIALMFISSPIGIILGAMIGLILVGLLTIINSGSILGTASALIWFVVGIAIIIYKLTQRRK